MNERPLWADAYPDGVPLHIDLGSETLVDEFERAVRHFPDHPAIDFFGRVTSYRQLSTQVHQVAQALLDRGVQPGDRVAVLLPACPQNIVATEAIMRIGAVAVQHNPLYTAEELVGPFQDHQAKIAIVWDKRVDLARELKNDAPLEEIIGVNLTEAMPRLQRTALKLPIKKIRKARSEITAPLPTGVTSWTDLLGGRELPIWHPRPAADDPAIMLYTSGTSGKPKGVPLTHTNLVANCVQGAAWARLRAGEETFMVVLPMFHAYGLAISVLAGINLGACLLTLPVPEISLIMKAIKRRRPTFLPAVPPLYAKILQSAKKQKIDLHGIRVGLSGAMSLPPKLVAEWEDATGGRLIEGYGLTETAPVVVGNPISDARRAGSIGVPFPDIEIRLASVDDVSKDAPEGGPGELLVRGPQVFSGYYNNPEATKDAFYDGFFRTGDVVVQDEGGFLTVVDRIKELIVTGGFNVYPTEVEDVLRQHDSVDDVAVVGVPAAVGGEDVVAAVVMADGHHEPDTKALRSHTKQHLTAYKAPRRFVAVSELPTNPMGKILRRDVVKLIEEIEQGLDKRKNS